MHDVSTEASTGCRQRGFMLVELLLAIGMLAVVAVLGWQGLGNILQARIVLTTEMDRLRGLQLAFAQLQRDCRMIASRDDIDGQPTLLVDGERIILVRRVLAEQQPTQLQVVGYLLQDGMLVRIHSPATRDLDRLRNFWQTALQPGSHGSAVVLQTDIRSMSVRAWVNDGNGWRDNVGATIMPVMIRDANGNWRPARAADAAVANVEGPGGIEVSLQLHKANGTVRKVLMLGAA